MPILRLKGCLGRSTMASPTTLHIGRPCHVRCTTRALDGPFPAPSALGWCQGHAPLGTWSTRGSTPRPQPHSHAGDARPPSALCPALPQPLGPPLPQPLPPRALAAAAPCPLHNLASAHCRAHELKDHSGVEISNPPPLSTPATSNLLVYISYRLVLSRTSCNCSTVAVRMPHGNRGSLW